MAKGNLFLGMGRGSVGDVVFYRANGQQLSRARNRNPKNPKTQAQVIQRAILATATQSYSRLKSIVDHSWQGVAYGGKSQSYFLGKAMDAIRSYVASTYPTFPESDIEADPTKLVGLAYPDNRSLAGVGLQISEGTVPSVPAIVAAGEDQGDPTPAILRGFGVTSMENTIGSIMQNLSLRAGDQITVCGLKGTGEFVCSRYVLKSELSSEDLALAWTPDGSAAAFDPDKTLLSSIRLEVINDTAAGGNVLHWVGSYAGVSVIISRLVDGVWQRSTQRLLYTGDGVEIAQYSTPYVLNLWMSSGSQIQTSDARYLNHAEESF